jgi:hypothetical protein
LKIAFGLSFFNLCVSRPIIQTTRFVVKYLQKPLTYKAETCSTVHKLQKCYFFLTFIKKTENQPLFTHQKGHNF